MRRRFYLCPVMAILGSLLFSGPSDGCVHQKASSARHRACSMLHRPKTQFRHRRSTQDQCDASDSVSAALDLGRSLLKKEDVDASIAAFTRAIQLDAKCADAYCERGKGHARNDHFDDALADWSEAIRLDPTLALPHACLGSFYAKKGDPQKAIAECTKAIQLDQKSSYAYATRAYAYNISGSADLAIADLTEAIRLDPTDFASLVNRASLYTGKGQSDAAITDCTQALRLNSNDDAAYSVRGWAHWYKGDVKAALADYAEAIRLAPTQPLYREVRGAIWITEGNYEQGMADFQTMLRLNPKDPAARFEANQKTDLAPTDLDHGQRQVRQMLHDRPAMASLGEKASPLYQWAARKFAGEDLHENILWNPAEPEMTSADHKSPEPGRPGSIRLARTYSEGPQKGDERTFDESWRDAVFELYNITGVDEFNRLCRDADEGKLSKQEYVTGVIACESRAAEKTRAFYLRVFLPWAKQWQVPTHPTHWFVANSDRSETLILSSADKTDSYWRHYEFSYDIIRLNSLARTGDAKKALELAAELEKQAMTNDEKLGFLWTRGTAYSQAGRHDEAIADFDKVIELDPANVDAYIGRAYVHIQSGRHDKAVADYSEAIRLAPKSAPLYLYRGAVFVQMNDFDKALADANTAIALDPKNKDARDLKDWLNQRATKKTERPIATPHSQKPSDIPSQNVGDAIK